MDPEIKAAWLGVLAFGLAAVVEQVGRGIREWVAWRRDYEITDDEGEAEEDD